MGLSFLVFVSWPDTSGVCVMLRTRGGKQRHTGRDEKEEARVVACREHHRDPWSQVSGKDDGPGEVGAIQGVRVRFSCRLIR